MKLQDNDELEFIAIWKAAGMILLGVALVPVLWFLIVVFLSF